MSNLPDPPEEKTQETTETEKPPKSAEVQAFEESKTDTIPDERPDLTSQEVAKNYSPPKKEK